mmetsp:Transcript_13633/g.30991  ORF Transcript_13633/g.30991 Transcript_13633/m.30991 type:complete len:257 (+) Transcript_13633:4385-5155(+)
MVPQVILICQIPSAAAVLMTPAVLGTGEINPLRMAELVAHEVQVALSTKTKHQQADHLVERQATIDAHGRRRALDGAHACVHLCIHQPESDGLVTNNSLVMRLHIAHTFLLPASVCQRVHNVPHVPRIISRLLEKLDEHVRDCHSQTVVKTKASVIHWQAEGRHATHILANSDGSGHQTVDQVVCQHEVDVALNVCIRTKVLMVATCVALADAVGVVKHRCDTIESESIEAVLFQPPADVGEQEAEDLVLQHVKDL